MTDLTLRSQYEHAMHLVQAQEYLEARNAARRILAAFPKHIGTYSILGQVHLQLGRQLEAAQLFHRVLSADPEHALAYANLGVIYEAQGLDNEALWQLQRAVEIAPADRGFRQIFRRVARSRGLPAQRLKLTRSGLARTYLRGQWYEKAIAEIRDVLADEPYRLDLQTALAEALWRQGRHGEAIEACERLLVDLPYCLKANLILGQMLLGTEREAEARACLQRAQALDPDNLVAQELFGSLSPLPPRTARLPAHIEGLDGQELGELYKEPGTALVTIEGTAHLPEPAFLMPPRKAAENNMPSPPDEHSVDATGEGRALPPWQAQQRYIQEHPDDYVARLALARRLRDVGIVDESLRHYATLIEAAPAVLVDVVHNLGLLTRLYPDSERLQRLIRRAQEELSQLGSPENSQ